MTKVPAYRFSGYTDAWEQRKLGEVSTHRGGTSIEKYFNENGPYKVISIGSYGLNGEYVDQGIRAVSNEVTDKRIVNRNELTMVLNDKTSNGTIIGRTLLIDSDDEFVVNQRTEIISPNDNLNPLFAFTLLNGSFREKVKKIVQGGTQIYVNYSSVEQLKLSLPTLAEQTSIGTFFQTLDQSIALHQRKLDTLKEQKKTCLQKMFPRNGKTIPEMRFPEFQDAPAWEQRKLGDVVEITKGVQRGKQEIKGIKSHNNQYPVFNGGQSESGYTDEYNRENKVMISEGGASAGYVNYYSGKYWSGGHNFTIDNLANDIYFIYSVLQSSQQKLYSLKVGSGLPNIQLNTIRNHDISLPTLPEQTAIGNFFQTLDRSITLHQRKIDTLKEMKQTLFKKMFI